MSASAPTVAQQFALEDPTQNDHGLAAPPCFGKARSTARSNRLKRNRERHAPARATKHSLLQVLAQEDLDGEPSDIPHQ
jgi:hypothetical protein